MEALVKFVQRCLDDAGYDSTELLLFCLKKMFRAILFFWGRNAAGTVDTVSLRIAKTCGYVEVF